MLFRSAYEKLIYQAVDRSLEIYLKAAQGENALAEVAIERLWKIGELAKAAGETVPTIRHWTKLGLVPVAETTPSGYQLFAPEMLSRCRKIQQLKSERLTLEEIKRRL